MPVRSRSPGTAMASRPYRRRLFRSRIWGHSIFDRGPSPALRERGAPAGIGLNLVGFTAIWVLVRRSPDRVSPASPGAGSTRDLRTVAELAELSSDRTARMRIAVVPMHTSPTAPRGQQAAGGLTVDRRVASARRTAPGIPTDRR